MTRDVHESGNRLQRGEHRDPERAETFRAALQALSAQDPRELGGERREHRVPIGQCRLSGTDGELEIVLASADAAQLTQLQDVVARHLVRFAFREELAITWSRKP